MQKGIRFWLLLISLFWTATAQAKTGGNASPKDTLFIDANVDNSNPYVGQEVVLTYSLYFRTVAPRIADSGKADHPGLWVQEVTPEGYIRSTPTSIGGMNLRKAVVKQLKLVPMQTGKLSVSNYRLRCFLPASTGVGLENRKDIETVVTAPTATIDAKPLPKSAPEGFSGAVGDFKLTLSSDKIRVHVGEPLALSVKISGKGNLKAFPQVALTFPAGFRPMETSVPTVTQDDRLRDEASVSSRISLNPEQPGNFRFSPVTLTVFNPWKGRYETISSGELAVTVLPGTKTSNQPSPDSLSAARSDKARWIPPAAMIFMSAVVLALIAALFVLGARLGRKPVILQKKTPEPPTRPVTSAPVSAEALQNRLYAALRKAGVSSPAGLTSRQLQDILEGLSVKPACSEALLELMQMIDQAVYTPGKTSKDALAALGSKTDKVLEALSRDCESEGQAGS
jgi:hypothetical protein